ncbi:hypothetical protein [Sulfuracidifex metallicus]|uniref:hypothetical protein n=1 Tax=Sulfuracidifex metallicus TaxID=47303 RepID=UPI0023F34F82|nr:hypothetical protein [Sulfuracidifex metallicus]
MTMVEALNKIMKNNKISSKRISYYPFLMAVKDMDLNLLSKKSKRDLNKSLEKLYFECRNYLDRYSKNRYICKCGERFDSAEAFYKHVLAVHILADQLVS